MTCLEIRDATAADLERMVSIEIAAAERFPLDVLPANVGRAGSREETQQAIVDRLAWVADSEDAGVVGFLVAQLEEPCLHIAEMDVLASHGRRGIGGRLLEHACAQAGQRGLAAITLTTFEQIPWNAPFYARHGFIAATEPVGFEHLRRALAHERARGLKGRVAMVREAGPADAIGCPR